MHFEIPKYERKGEKTYSIGLNFTAPEYRPLYDRLCKLRDEHKVPMAVLIRACIVYALENMPSPPKKAERRNGEMKGLKY